jgi:putative flippase GtrA
MLLPVKEITRFLIVGGIATIGDIVLFRVLSEIMPPNSAFV